MQKTHRKILYLKIIRALYGCIEAALAWYNLFTTILKDDGFDLNPYDKCVANKIIDGKQCTVAWHVDDWSIILVLHFILRGNTGVGKHCVESGVRLTVVCERLRVYAA